MNLIKSKFYTDNGKNNDCSLDIKSSPKYKPSIKKYKKISIAFLVLSIIFTGLVTVVGKSHRAEAATYFGLGNDYNEIIQLNENLSNNVPVPIQSISMTHTTGDKRVVALLLFFQKYNSPMASASVAKAFVDAADQNGFGDKWQLLPAISGIESAFGKITPRKANKPSYNAWGWGGPGNWHYFTSWEDAAEKISRGIAKGYGATGLVPERMMASYCPPCAKSGGHWAKAVNGYMNELTNIYKSL